MSLPGRERGKPHPRVPAVTVLGAAGTVTGSSYLVESAEGARVLVDVGLFQGPKALRLRNWAPFAVEAASIDAVVITHAHVDHCGLLPKLVVEGFTGPVYVTPGTERLVRIVLPDSGYLHEEEAAFANRKGYSKHHPALPLYTRADAERCLEQLHPVGFDIPTTVAPGVEVVFAHAGHILGAASPVVRFTGSGHRVAFSGDLGRSDHPLLVAPDPMGNGGGPLDVAVCETTYGDREAPDVDVAEVLASVVTEAGRRGGVVIIPAFAVDRTEMILHHLDDLVRSGRTPSIPVFVDSPMASAALRVYRAGAAAGDPEFRPEVQGCELFPSIDLTEVRTVEQSKDLNGRRGPMVIISASGMATGGRVLHHLANRLGDSRNTVVLVGFQAPGTRGARLAAGESTVKLLGAEREVSAKVVVVPLSAHADRHDLLAWLRSGPMPRQVLLTHGEPAASAAFAEHLHAHGFDRDRVIVPEVGHRVALT
jgi:metallo-beta-lactamase family protein